MALYKNAYELANKRKQKDDFVSALSELKTNNTLNANKQNSFADNFNSGYTAAGGEGNGLNNMGSLLGKGLASLGSNSGGSSAISTGINNFVSGSGGTGSAISNAINGTGGSGSAISDAIISNVSSSGGSNSFLSKLRGGSSGGSSVPWAAIGSLAKGGYNSISGKDDKDYSDLEESIIYPLQGASMGAAFGPWGAAGGALYGLGYSFKDDLGLKDSNFLTQLLFPIGMGDGGGLRIGDKPILDLG